MFKRYLAVCVILIVTLPTNAQSNFDQLLIFGDSLLDVGNLGQRFTNRVGDGSGDYSVGDFVPIAPQLLADNLGLSLQSAVAGGTNYAVGGYQTADILNSIAGAGLALPSGGAIALPAYLTSNPVIASKTLVLIDGGGNDLRSIVSSNPPSAVPGLLSASAQTLASAVGALDAVGAKYIMLANVPDLGFVPGIQAAELASPGAVAGFSSATQGFNSGVKTLLNLSLRDANIIPVDLNGLVSLVLSRAEDYGLTVGMIDIGGGTLFDTRYMCFNDDSDNNPATPADCLEHPLYGIDGVTPNPDRLFFNDSLHPTALGGVITSDYLTDILLAPRKVGLLPEMALSAGRAQVAVTGNELRQSRWTPSLQGRLFITGDVSNAEYETNSSLETETTQLTVGITYVAADNLLVGASVAAGVQEANLSGADFEADSFSITGLLGYREGPIFIDASLGISVLSYDDLERDVKLGSQTFTATGSTDGHAWVLDTLLGYDVLASQTYHLAPVLGVRWLDSTVESYKESGGEVSNYNWSEQNRKSVQWRYGIVAAAQVSQTVQLYLEVFGSKEEEDDLNSIGIRNTNLDFSHYQLPSYQADGDSFVVGTVGASVELGGSSLNLLFNYSDQGDGFEHVLLSYSIPM